MKVSEILEEQIQAKLLEESQTKQSTLQKTIDHFSKKGWRIDSRISPTLGVKGKIFSGKDSFKIEITRQTDSWIHDKITVTILPMKLDPYSMKQTKTYSKTFDESNIDKHIKPLIATMSKRFKELKESREREERQQASMDRILGKK